MATPGTYISIVGHAGFLVWLIAGWGFAADPLDFEVTQVSVISGEEYAALAAATTPDPVTDAPEAPVSPLAQDTPDLPEPVTEPTPLAEPEPVPAPTEEAQPTTPEPLPTPDTEVGVTPPVAPAAPVAPPPAPDLEVSDTPVPRPADRVAPTPVAPPPPDADVADTAVDRTTPSPEPAPEPVPEPEPEAAPEEAATEIVTEAEEPSTAVTTSLRPQVRPNRPAPQPNPEPEPEETQTADVLQEQDADVEAAVASALEAMQPPTAQGPPMTGAEREGFRVAVNKCWNVDGGSLASRVTVEVGFSLTREGRVDGEVRLLGAEGDSSATDTAFQAARRAILRCQTEAGYDLPVEKYEQWKDVVITFDPSGMRLR